MRVCHDVTAVFDDPNLVSCAGLAPVLRLAERAELQRLVAQHMHLDRPGGVNALLKVPGLIAGMVVGADSIEDMDLLRHGAMRRLFARVRAPSTLLTFLRSFSFGHVRQLDAVAEHEDRSIRQYVEGQLHDEEDGVTLVQRVGQERVAGTTYSMYDVHTIKGRWWVITIWRRGVRRCRATPRPAVPAFGFA